MNNNILKLIETVYYHYVHIDELMTLSRLIGMDEEVCHINNSEEYIVIMTTINSKYNYTLYCNPLYTNPAYHIDAVLSKKENQIEMISAEKPL